VSTERKVEWTSAALLHSTPLYSTILCSTLLYFTLLYSTLLYSTVRYTGLVVVHVPDSQNSPDRVSEVSHARGSTAEFCPVVLLEQPHTAWRGSCLLMEGQLRGKRGLPLVPANNSHQKMSDVRDERLGP
jgi:hypothetical protein